MIIITNAGSATRVFKGSMDLPGLRRLAVLGSGRFRGQTSVPYLYPLLPSSSVR